MPQLFDSHSHIHFNAYKDDYKTVIAFMLESGVWTVTVGTQRDTSKRGIEVAEEYTEGVYASVGLHPNHLFPVHIDEDEVPFMTREEDFDYAYYKQLAQSSKKVVAIGECGLDYYRIPETLDLNVVKEKQERVFRAHLDLADELGLPIIGHIRDAHSDTIQILKEYVDAGKLARRGVIHCFTSTADYANAYVALGFYVSFTGVITFPPKKSNPASQDELWNAVRAVPLEKLLIETDAPYLTPEPFRGKRNIPNYVEYVARKVAELKEISFEEVARHTTENARHLFFV